MKASSFEYMRPDTIGDAVAALADSDGGGRILAGGQSLMPMMNLRLVAPELLIDIGAISQLRDVHHAGDEIRIGSRITHADIEDGLIPGRSGAMLSFVARDIAYRAVRNRGTVGGSLGHADPAADWPVAFAAIGASICVMGKGGERFIPADEFVLDTFTTALEPEELIVGVRIPDLSDAARWSYVKIRRKAGAFGEALAAVVTDRERGINRVVISSSHTGGPRRVSSIEALLAEAQGADADSIGAAVDALAPGIDPYYHRLHLVSLQRALSEVVA